MDMGLLELTITAVKSDSDGEQVSYSVEIFCVPYSCDVANDPYFT